MNEQLLVWAKQAVEAGIKYVPAVVQQYLTWWACIHMFWAILSLVLLIWLTVFYFVSKHSWLKTNKVDDMFDDPRAWYLIPYIGWPICMIVLIANAYYLLKIKVAPAVYIIDSLTGSK